MRSFILILSAVILTFFSASVAMAQSMEVDVNAGYSVAVEKDFLGGEDWRIVGNLGLTDQFLFKLSYAGDSKAFGLGGRYELGDGLAVVFDYIIDGDDNLFNVGLRDRINLQDSLDLVGELKLCNSRVRDSLTDETHGTISWTYTLQLQQQFSAEWVGNLDLAYYYSHGDTDILGAIGADYKGNGYKLYFDYRIYPDNDENTLTTGIEIGL